MFSSVVLSSFSGVCGFLFLPVNYLPISYFSCSAFSLLLFPSLHSSSSPVVSFLSPVIYFASPPFLFTPPVSSLAPLVVSALPSPTCPFSCFIAGLLFPFFSCISLAVGRLILPLSCRLFLCFFPTVSFGESPTSVTCALVSFTSFAALVVSLFPPTPLHFFRFHRLLRCSCPIPALRLLSTAVCLSDCFLLDDASFRHLCFRFLHLLRCSCPIPSPSLSPLLFSSFFFSSLVPPIPRCHLCLLFLDLLFLFSFPRIFNPLL